MVSFIFISNRKHLLITLISLEFIILVVYGLIFIILNILNYEYYYRIIFLTFRVCEGALGIDLISYGLILLKKRFINITIRSLIPTFFLILGWGYQPERLQAGFYLLFYTLFASLPLFIFSKNTHIFCSFMTSKSSCRSSSFRFYNFSRSFIKIRGVWTITIGGVLIRLVCLIQVDIKALIAYSSVAHIGIVIAGSYVLIIGHGLCSSGLFCLSNIVYERTGRRINMIRVYSRKFGFNITLSSIEYFNYLLKLSYFLKDYISGEKYINRFIILVLIFVLSIILLIISPNLIRILLGLLMLFNWGNINFCSYNKKSTNSFFSLITCCNSRPYSSFCFSSFINFSYCWGLFISRLTIFIAGLGANFEFDLKKIIALSTLSQLGLIIRILGIGFSYLAFFHLITHALFKALLFICAGVVIHNIKNFQDIRYIGLTVCYRLRLIYFTMFNNYNNYWGFLVLSLFVDFQEYPLTLGDKYLKIIDIELLGGQNLYKIFSIITTYLQVIHNNNLKLYLILFFLWITTYKEHSIEAAKEIIFIFK
uniref:NADH-ubiquinone oxidoreductase chain 5 n=1 Tax=Culicoides sonorensis TaxID=179676 RepID=A0A336MVL7_CULSO